MERWVIIVVLIPLLAPLAVGQGLEDLLDVGSVRANAGVRGDVAEVNLERRNLTGTESLSIALDARRGEIRVTETDPYDRRGSRVTIQIARLIEFNDTDGDGVYTPDVDVAISEQPFRNIRWTALPIREFSDGHQMRAFGQLPSGGLVVLSLATTGAYAAPRTQSFDVEALEVGFEARGLIPSSPGTMLALEAVTRTTGSAAAIASAGKVHWPPHVAVNQVTEVATAATPVSAQGFDPRRGEATYISFGFPAIGAASTSTNASVDANGSAGMNGSADMPTDGSMGMPTNRSAAPRDAPELPEGPVEPVEVEDEVVAESPGLRSYSAVCALILRC